MGLFSQCTSVINFRLGLLVTAQVRGKHFRTNNKYIFIFSAFQMAYASSNPWDVPQIDSFNFLCCPECVYRSKEESTFQVKIYNGFQ